jgi:HSP20 family protein
MALEAWNPWKELERVQAEMDEHFRSVLEKIRKAAPGKPLAFVPAIDVVETVDEYQIIVSLPGMVEEDIDITLLGRELIIRGEREPPYDSSRAKVHMGQWKYGFFERRVELPETVNGEAIRASYDGGALTVRIPKLAASGDAAREEGGAA